MNDEIIEAMKALAPLNWDKAKELATKFDVKPRAIVASAIRQGLEYERKKRVSKGGEPVLRKPELVQKIAECLNLSADNLGGLDKASKSALQVIVDILEK